MYRCLAEHADLLLDGEGWIFVSLYEAVEIRNRLAGLQGVEWPDWPATRRRLAEGPDEENGEEHPAAHIRRRRGEAQHAHHRRGPE